MAASPPPDRHRSDRRRRRDRRARWWTAAAALLIAVSAGALLARLGERLFAARPSLDGANPSDGPVLSAVEGRKANGTPSAGAQRIDGDGGDAPCMPAQLQSFDTWQLARIERAPVETPKKRAWERTLGNPAAIQTALRDRLTGWPATLLADRAALPREPAAFARRVARDTWRGLEALSDREHGLPLDTVRFGNGATALADATIGDYTSTTNIGMHLLGVVAALDLALLDTEQARARIGRTLDTLEGLETDGGLFFNYYDTTSLERTSHFVSFVDSGWLAAGLIVVRNAFPELHGRCSGLLDRMRLAAFYDPAYDLMSHGYFVEPRGPSRYHYGVLYTEARLAVLIAIGRGDAPQSVWFSMVRTFPAGCRWQSRRPVGVREKTIRGHRLVAGYYQWHGSRYVPSWGGSMFEALMPALVLDEARLAPSSLGVNDRVHLRIQRHVARDVGLAVWGLSPSATPDSELYGEYGVRILGSLGYPVGPVTPHASALALDLAPKAALANLRRLARRYDVYGDFGFYDAVDARTGQVAYTYLTLDQSMILLALANHLADRSIQKRFAADPIIQRVLPLLAAENFFE